MAIMDDNDKVAQQAQELAAKHPKQVKKALAKADEMLNTQTGGMYSSEIHTAGDKTAGLLTHDPSADS